MIKKRRIALNRLIILRSPMRKVETYMTVRTRRLLRSWGQWQKVCFFVGLVVLGTVLNGCGKKPDQVDPPPGVVVDHFPRVYPNIATDPKP